VLVDRDPQQAREIARLLTGLDEPDAVATYLDVVPDDQARL
jgi:hypothetical protein